MHSGLSLAEYAAKRSRIAGRAILEEINNPWFQQVDRLRSDVEAKGGSLISFANYDYLGLSGHETIKEAASEALERFGTGALGSRLVGGERTIHTAFEEDMARFVGTEACLALVSGYLTNVSIISHLLSSKDLLLIDELCHNSIVAGSKGTRANVITFRHNDLDHLDELLTTHRANHRSCLIVVEGLYSMDGDLPDLPRLLDVKERHGSWLLIDEAHSIGVLGDHGRGLSQHYGEDANRIDLIVGTLSKAFVSCGGFVCGKKDVIDWLRFTLPGFVYSVGLSPVITAAAHTALKLLIAQPQRTARLRLISELFLQKAQAAGLDTGSAVGRGVVSIIFSDLFSTMLASEALLKANIFAPPIVHVGVPKDQPRIRFFLSARHEPQHLDDAISVLRTHMRTPRLPLDVAL